MPSPISGEVLCTHPPRVVPIQRLLLLVNPFAGKGKGHAALQAVVPVFDGAGVVTEVYQSVAPGDLQAKASEAPLSDYDALCVLGGDGSVHEVLNGMLSRADGQRLPLAIVPCGTGNSFVSDFKPKGMSPKESAESILRGEAYTIDAGRVEAGTEQHYFFNMVNWPADYLHRADDMRWMGSHRYKASAFMDIMAGRMCRKVRMLIDDEEWQSEPIMLVHVQNNKTCGDGMRGAPMARVDDGLLDLFFVPKCGRVSLLTLLSESNTGAHVNNPNTVFRRFRRLTVQALDGAPAVVNVDGEIVGSDPLTIEVVPAAFEVIV